MTPIIHATSDSAAVRRAIADLVRVKSAEIGGSGSKSLRFSVDPAPNSVEEM